MIKYAVICFLSVLTGITFPAGAQRNNIWYFGGQSGLDFNQLNSQGNPVALDNSAMNADEGCSSICDENGNLLFYTNGVTIYNRLHQPMQNGDQIGANISSLQSSVIVPHPGNDDLYYIFTSDAIENDFSRGYRYSLVDMRGDNGLGTVTTKSNLLVTPSTERLAATRHANGVDVWVITNDHNSNIFRSWLVSCNGLQPAPVVSAAGDMMNIHSTMNVGAIRISPDGKKLCQTHFPEFVAGGGVSSFFQVFDFDNATGMVSNARKISSTSDAYINGEFSPNSKYLYLTDPFDAVVGQFDVSLNSAAAISASAIIIPASPGIRGIQLGPDGKIYLAYTGNSLDVINSPDLAGAQCNYQKKQVTLLRPATLGFPAYVNDFSVNPLNGFTHQVVDSCQGIVRFTGMSTMGGALSWSWDFGDGQVSAVQNPVHVFTPANQQYTVRLKITSLTGCGEVTRIKIINPAGSTLEPDFDISGGCDSGYIRFINNNPLPPGSPYQYTWYFGDGTTSTETHPTHVFGPGDHVVKLVLRTGTPCLDDSVSRTVNMGTLSGSVSISPDRVIFAGQSVRLFAEGPGDHYEWMPSTGLDNPFIQQPVASPASDILYTVRISKTNGCYVEAQVRITVVELDDVYVPTGFTPNNDGKNDLLRPILGTKFTLHEFSVFNRWGEKIFSTMENGKGWDGKINGILQHSGAYVWMLRVSGSTGAVMERKGTFILIR